ncbi:MAG: bifunctional phosphoribosylaminoimidazolecarboxamide formyltransferase/IMP cyclohydrolase [Weeksellaceae bacterium]|nr:bifunctional phosphoribosylaminoimidazolecarboxamide formyltransferase/IMP cyclohydrolase [Weeksellaceae bacterium]
MIKTALLSVFDKTGIVELASDLSDLGYRILSTGGTYSHLKKAGIKVVEVSELTGFPEMMDGRVKTLHPHIHGGILHVRSNEQHLQDLQQHGISSIDIVVVNLYPFFSEMQKNLAMDDLIEFIDIGGPTMLRAAAKSFRDVLVLTDVADYDDAIKDLRNGEVSLNRRKELAAKVFNLTSAYDAAVAAALHAETFPEFYTVSYRKSAELRYGENPHQRAAYYTQTTGLGALANFDQLQGKELSFNNMRDMEVAWRVVQEFEDTACCAVKHSTPCGVALGNSVEEAYRKAHDCDPMSIFGGIVAFNRRVDAATAQACTEIFLEIVVAPDFDQEALDVFAKKKNLRIIRIHQPLHEQMQMVQTDGGLLVQERDLVQEHDYKVVTDTAPTAQQLSDLEFAMKIIKHVKSNAIVVAANGMALGVGTGETNRIWAAQQAVERAREKYDGPLAMASEAFFPFRDVVDFAAENAVNAIVQPGGSIQDKESIAAANEHGIAMVFTGIRHFLH